MNVSCSDDDYTLSAGEAGFRYLVFDLLKSPIEVRSKLEVEEQLRGLGLGSLFFKSYELLAEDGAYRLPDIKESN